MTYEEILKSLEDYEPLEDLKDFPIEIIAMMCYHQVKQGNYLDVKVFANHLSIGKHGGGFTWDKTIEGQLFWEKVLQSRNFEHYFQKYPRKPIKRVQVSLMEIADWKECEVDDIEIVN